MGKAGRKFEYDPKSNGAADYMALTDEILTRNYLVN